MLRNCNHINIRRPGLKKYYCIDCNEEVSKYYISVAHRLHVPTGDMYYKSGSDTLFGEYIEIKNG